MSAEWNNQDNRPEARTHDTSMRQFRRAHAGLTLTNGRRRTEASRLTGLEVLQVSRPVAETGGAVILVETLARSDFIPMWRVARYRLSEN